MAKQPTQASPSPRAQNITNGIAHVNSTFNNTMITISDVQEILLPGHRGYSWVQGIAKIYAFCSADGS